ncbi:MAG: hypothetical protein ABEJ30_07365 [Halorientalis sp.]
MLNRQVLGAVLMGLLLATAGCSGLTGGGEPGAGTGTPTDGGNSGPGGEVTAAYTFSEGESYTYVSETQQGSSSITWTVESVSDGQVTVNISTQRGGTTVTASQANIFNRSRQQSMSAAVFVTFLRLPVLAASGHTLEEGNSWTVSGSDLNMGGQSSQMQDISVEITGTDTVAGTECYTAELSSAASNTTMEACLRADWPFALSVGTAGGSGTSQLDISVDQFERP